MLPQDQEEQPQKQGRLTWLWMLFSLLIAALALWYLWWWQHNRPVFSGVCQAQDMALSMGRSDGTAGTTYVHAVITNNGNHTCTVSGYPVVSVLDERGENHFTGDAQHNALYPAGTVTLGPHDSAHAVVGFPDSANFDPGSCLTDARTLRLYLPTAEVTPGLTSLTTASDRDACPGLSVTALQPGA